MVHSEADATPTGQPGRPRNQATHGAVLQAAFELVAEHGYEGMTMEAVAARAGVAKTTVYRRWPTRIDLVIEVARHVASRVRLTPSNDLRADLVALMRDVIAVLDTPIARRVVPRVLAEARERRDLADALSAFWIERRSMLGERLRAAVDDGELAGNLDLDIAADALYGPIYYRYLVTGAPLSGGLAEQVVDHALDGMRAR